MRNNPVFFLQMVAMIKGEGLTFFGYINNNQNLEIGDFIEFDFEGRKIKRRIRRIGLVNSKENYERGFYSISVFITCKDKIEAKNISKSNLKNVECIIYKE